MTYIAIYCLIGLLLGIADLYFVQRVFFRYDLWWNRAGLIASWTFVWPAILLGRAFT